MDVGKTLLVARWEFIKTITRRTYVFAVIAMPVFYGVILTVAGVAGRSVTRGESARAIAIVDDAHIVDFDVARRAAEASAADTVDVAGQLAPPQQRLTPYPDIDRALADLRARVVSAVYVVEADYLATGRLTTYGSDIGLMSIAAERRRQTQVANAIRASLLHAAMSGDALARAYAPAAKVTRMHVDSTGAVTPDDASSAAGPFAGPFGVFFMLTMAIFFSAGFLQQATVEDRQNRMIEILLSSLDTNELLIGKMIGLSGAGLLQVGLYVLLLIVPGIMVLAIIQVSLAKLALALVYFVLGYTLFASLMAGTGVLGRSAQESAQLSTIWTLTSASPMFFLPAISAAPNGGLARALSFFPLTAPVTMLVRLSSTDPPLVDILGSILLGVAAIYFALRAASKLLRAAALMYGKRPTLPELIRWLRAT
jgi:ABC-2 type transport system permease protein